jgi:adenylate cyclase
VAISSKKKSLDGNEKFQLARVRHDMRTPINHIIGYSEILLEEAEGHMPPEFLHDLEKIHSGGLQLVGLINLYLGEDSFYTHGHDRQRLCHELRTPANHIIGFGELLIETCEDLGRQEFEADLRKVIEAGRSWLGLMETQLLNECSTQMFRKAAADGSGGARGGAWSNIQRSLFKTSKGGETSSTEQGRLLLADDDAGNRDLLQRRLEKLGFSVVACADGTEALKRIREGGFDLALLDMVMPGLDGHKLLALIKGDVTLQNLPVIMISALDQMESIVQCIELGAEDYLAKPFNPVLLRARIGAALEKKRLRDLEQVYIKRIEEEQAQSERLLLNVLPKPIADRLKQGETTIVDSFQEATVLFADLAGFTSLSVRVPPKVVVKLLDEIFTAFDELADRYGIEKIKTIGDAYMAVAGLPLPRSDHAQAATRMAIELHAVMKRFNIEQGTALEMRVGLNSGPVIAGIIGRRKFIYDLWGDTVNTASRMESHGEPGRIQITEATSRLIGDEFRLTPRGVVSIKGKGELNTWWVDGEK